MEILFKCDRRFYYIEYDELCWVNLLDYPDVNLDSIPHLGIIKVLYHYKNNIDGERYPVYYEHNDMFITKTSYTSKTSYTYTTFMITNNYIKDYTLINLNLI